MIISKQHITEAGRLKIISIKSTCGASGEGLKFIFWSNSNIYLNNNMVIKLVVYT